MHQNFMFSFLFRFSPSPSFCILVLFLVARIALASVDPFFLSCVPRSCGDGQIIRYPFYIQGLQEQFCGYPGFHVSCNNKGNPVLKLHDNDYIINQIFYNNQSLRLSNAAVSETNATCDIIPLIQNLSLPVERFELVPNQTEVFFLSNCNSSLPGRLLQYKADNCENETNTILALYKDDPNLGYALTECNDQVAAPVDVYEEAGDLGIEETIRRGFLVTWIASNCSVCETSGGKCGFNASTYHFKCFCPDRPHAAQCAPGTILIESVLSTESKYEACKPRNCGIGPNISYPFFIYDAGADFCGYPGFGIDCEQNTPIYRTSSGHFIIQDISYENQSFRLVDEEVFNDTCIAPVYNFSFDRSSLNFRPYHADLIFFHNCNDLFNVNYTKSVVTCASSTTNTTFVALVPRDENVNWPAIACDFFVAAPVQLEELEINQTINSFDYVKLLKNGFTLKWTGYNCAECKRSGGQCGFEEDNSVCFCPDGSHLLNCNDGKGKLGKLKLGLGLGLGIGLGGTVIVFVSIYIIRRYKKQKYTSPSFKSRYTSSEPSSKSELEVGCVYFGVPIFSYSELAEVTNNFSHENELGDGGFGTVYYAKLRDGREVAVKRLYDNNYRRVEQFMNEIEILTRLRHNNLVSLYGCTSRHSQQGLLLVYEYIPNGTVADHLHGDRAKPGSLTWPIRLNIAIETASALAYLHASDTIHRDVKTNNILLDNNFCVKVADFGLSRLFPTDVTHVSTAPQGSPGYVDPEYHQCYQLTDKSDVYSFGVVLIELISSMPAVDITRHKHEINLANLAISRVQKCAIDELIDPCLGHQSDEEVKRMTTSVAELAFLCLQQNKEMRPPMDVVLEELKRIKSGENFKFENLKEQHDDNEVFKSMQPPQSPPDSDERAPLKPIRVLSSPLSVTAKWVSSDTTPNVSS